MALFAYLEDSGYSLSTEPITTANHDKRNAVATIKSVPLQLTTRTQNKWPTSDLT